jgi:hypothetical protein
MAFSWTSITALTTEVMASHMNEVKTNVDHLTTQLGVSAYSWSTLPVSVDGIIYAANVNELQDAIDYVDGLNTCAAYNATHDNGVLSGDDNSIHTGKDASILSGQDSGIHTGKDASVLSGQDSGIHTGKDASILSGQDSGIHTGKDSNVLSSQNTYYLNDHNGSILSGQYSTVYNPYYSSNCSSNWGSAQNGANGAVYSGNK